MKRHFFSLVVLLLFTQVCIAKVIENPYYEFCNSAIPKITKIELTDTETILHIRCTYKPNWWITIDDKATIKNSNGDEVYTIKSLEGGELNAQLVTPECGYQDLILHFDAIEKGITEIDWGEDKGWKIFNIDLTGKKRNKWDSMIPKELHGNWSDKAGIDGWCYGFYEDFALIDNNFWEYKKVEKHSGGYRLSLECNGKLKRIYVKVNGDNLAIGKTSTHTSLYTTEKPIYKTRGISTSDIKPFKTGSMVLNGYIEGYSTLSGLKTGLVYSDNNIIRNSEQSLITIEENGQFSATIELGHANRSFIRFDNIMIDIYATPSDTLTLYLSYEGMLQQGTQGPYYLPRDLRAMGANARLNVEMGDLNSYIHPTLQQNSELQTIRNSVDIKEYGNRVLSMYREDSVKLEQQLLNSNFMPASKKIARTSLVTEFFDRLISYTFNGKRTYSKQEEVDKGIICAYQDYGYPDDYFNDILKRIDVGDHTSMMFCNFDAFINRYEFAPFFGFYSSTFDPLNGMERLINAGVISTDEEYKNIFNILNENRRAFKENRKEDIVKLDSLSSVKLTALIEKHMKMVKNLYSDSLIYIPLRATIKDRIDKSREFWGSDGDIISQIVIARTYKYGTYELNQEQEKKYLDIVLEYVTDPNISKHLTNKFNKKYAKKDDVSLSKPIPDGSGKVILEKLLKPHKGKYVMIDFWASSCGPCIYGIDHSHNVRKKLSNKPIVFMFVTDKRSTSQSGYDKHMTPVVGDKHYISIDEWNKIASLFNINSIPRYILFDKEGMVIDDHFNGWNAIEAKLNELDI